VVNALLAPDRPADGYRSGHPIMMGRPRRARPFGRMPNGGGYPLGFVEFAYEVLGVDDPAGVLHVCSGSMQEGITIDVRVTVDVRPQVQADGRALPFRDAVFRWVLLDPPYSEMLARRHFQTHYPYPRGLLREAARVVAPGGRVGILHYLSPAAPRGLVLADVYGVYLGANSRIRAFTVYHRPACDATGTTSAVQRQAGRRRRVSPPDRPFAVWPTVQDLQGPAPSAGAEPEMTCGNPVCGARLSPAPVGRPPLYCSPACRTAAYRRRRRADRQPEVVVGNRDADQVATEGVEMADRSAIEWTEATWNPTTGCDRVSTGCDHCYALDLARRLRAMGQPKYQNDGDPRTSGPGFGITVHPDALDIPRRWRAPRHVFVNSMSDLFHAKVPVSFIRQVFDVMAETPQHTYQVLTKRSRRLAHLADQLPWPTNVWIGVSVEDPAALGRLGDLRKVPAAVRFLSCEPLLGSLAGIDLRGMHWVIAGGESGRDHRPVERTWVTELRDVCNRSGVPFFFKQWGGRTPKAGGRLLEGRTWDEMPVGRQPAA
jgi:protein gp37